MKNYYFLFIVTVALLAGFLPSLHAVAQNNKDSIKAAGITALINNQHYVFKAQTATPLSGGLRQLTGDYDLQVSKEKVISQLPYFGRAYSASLNPSDNGLQFTSKDFEYNVTQKKKDDGWDIAIKFKDANGTQQMQLNVFSNGSASLQVIGNNRQPISFNGYIAPPDKIK